MSTAAYRAAHRKEARAYRAAHREEIRAYRAAHRKEARAYRAAYYATHREEIRAQRAVYNAALRAKKRAIVEILQRGGCHECGSHRALHQHHTNPRTKVIDISSMVCQTDYSISDLRAELAKTITLCRKCHTDLHAKRGKWAVDVAA